MLLCLYLWPRRLEALAATKLGVAGVKYVGVKLNGDALLGAGSKVCDIGASSVPEKLLMAGSRGEGRGDSG